MPRAFTEQERSHIAHRLLEQGHKLFSAYGLKKTSVEELARAAGISKAAFYLFYESKEALFMDVVERVEEEFRLVVLDAIDQPGAEQDSSPRARLTAVFRLAFSHWKEVPLLRFFGGSDYDLIYSRVPAEVIAEHLQSDAGFSAQLVARCQQNGIPIRIPTPDLDALLHALFFNALHEEDLGQESGPRANRILIELVAAYCLGETTLLTVDGYRTSPTMEARHEPGD